MANRWGQAVTSIGDLVEMGEQVSFYQVDGAKARKGVSRVALVKMKISVVCSHNGRPDESPAFLLFPLLLPLIAGPPRTVASKTDQIIIKIRIGLLLAVC